MNTVLLTQSGELNHQGSPVAADPLPFLNHAVTLVPELTLRAYFRLLERHPMLARLNHFFKESLNEYRSCAGDNCCTEEFNHLEFGKSVEMIGYPGSPAWKSSPPCGARATGAASGFSTCPWRACWTCPCGSANYATSFLGTRWISSSLTRFSICSN